MVRNCKTPLINMPYIFCIICFLMHIHVKHSKIIFNIQLQFRLLLITCTGTRYTYISLKLRHKGVTRWTHFKPLSKVSKISIDSTWEKRRNQKREKKISPLVLIDSYIFNNYILTILIHVISLGCLCFINKIAFYMYVH